MRPTTCSRRELGEPGSLDHRLHRPGRESAVAHRGHRQREGPHRRPLGSGRGHGLQEAQGHRGARREGRAHRGGRQGGLRDVQRRVPQVIKASRFLTQLSRAAPRRDTQLPSLPRRLPRRQLDTRRHRRHADRRQPGRGQDGRLQAQAYGCSACPVRCGGWCSVQRGPVRHGRREPPAGIRDLGALGNNLRNDDVEAVIQANEICNRFGIDTISVGGAIAFAIECYENGDHRLERHRWPGACTGATPRPS